MSNSTSAYQLHQKLLIFFVNLQSTNRLIVMKYLSPDIAKLAKGISDKKLAKIGTSCGIFQDCFDNEFKYTNSSKIGKPKDAKQPR